MQRLMKIKEKLEVIEAAISKQHPHYIADPDITALVTELKDYVQEERKKIQKLKSREDLSELESTFIEPAIDDIYLNSIDKIRRGSRPSADMNSHIFDTSFTLRNWLVQVSDYEEKQK